MTLKLSCIGLIKRFSAESFKVPRGLPESPSSDFVSWFFPRVTQIRLWWFDSGGGGGISREQIFVEMLSNADE
jgi:hypothetical protein